MHDFMPSVLAHHWQGVWELDAKESHLAHVTVHERLTAWGWYVPGTYQRADVTQVGPGIVHLEFQTLFGKVVVFQTLLPLGPFYQKCQHVAYAERKVPRFFVKFLLYNLAKQLERDIPIWNTKVYVAKPVLVKHDGKIAQFRRWYAKFYSENSPTAESCKNNMDW
jgi:cholesterol 7-dehydrogenase